MDTALAISRAEAAYLGLALGDALGATVEFMTPREIAGRHGVHRDIVGGGWLLLGLSYLLLRTRGLRVTLVRGTERPP